MAKYCMDCGHYIPGGGDHNCMNASRNTAKGHYVCALKEACDAFYPKEEKKEVIFAPIVRKKRKRKVY